MQNIMHITFDMRIGGTEMVIRNIIEGLQSAPFRMSIFCIESPIGPWGEELERQGVSITSTQRQPGFDLALVREIRRYIKKKKIDIVHCHQYTPWVYGAAAALFTNANVIFTEHGRFYPDTSSWKRKMVNPFFVAITDKITSISQATKHALVEYEFIPESKIETIYNGIRPLHYNAQSIKPIRDTLKIPEDHKILGTIARFDPIKNHKMMLFAFSLVLSEHPNTTLVIVGDGEERENIERIIEDLNLDSNVVLTGYQSKPVEYLALMDIFLLSSLSEGTSMTLLEAMSLSKPCIVTDAGGNAEIVIDGETGIVTPNDNAEQFANAVNTLLSQGYATLSINAKKRFDAYFSDAKMNMQFNDLYMGLTND